jgi:hypothetical protein
MFTETKMIAEFCAEIGSVNQAGKTVFEIKTNNDPNHKNYGKRHIQFKDAQNSKAMVATKLTAEELKDAGKLQVSWFESPDSDLQGFMVHGIGVSASYDVTEVVIG